MLVTQERQRRAAAAAAAATAAVQPRQPAGARNAAGHAGRRPAAGATGPAAGPEPRGHAQGGAPPPQIDIPATSPGAATAVRAALSQVGKGYRFAAAGPDAYDCSGLTMWAWAQAGVSLPHYSKAQYESLHPRAARTPCSPAT